MAEVSCSICTTTEGNPKVEGIVPDMPTGWSTVTVAERGRRLRNFLLCKACTTAVRDRMTRLGERHRDSVTA